MWATLPKPFSDPIARREARRGFTIVELLIVIVVIGILAAITIVAYNPITQRACEVWRSMAAFRDCFVRPHTGLSASLQISSPRLGGQPSPHFANRYRDTILEEV